MNKRLELVDFAFRCKSQTRQPSQVLNASILEYSAKTDCSIINFPPTHLSSQTQHQTRIVIKAKTKLAISSLLRPLPFKPADEFLTPQAKSKPLFSLIFAKVRPVIALFTQNARCRDAALNF